MEIEWQLEIEWQWLIVVIICAILIKAAIHNEIDE